MFVDLVGDLLPLLLTSFGHQLPEEGVLVKGPGGLLRLLLVLRLPLVVALVVVAAGHKAGYVLPVVHCEREVGYGLLAGVGDHGPLEQARLLLAPVLLDVAPASL